MHLLVQILLELMIILSHGAPSSESRHHLPSQPCLTSAWPCCLNQISPDRLCHWNPHATMVLTSLFLFLISLLSTLECTSSAVVAVVRRSNNPVAPWLGFTLQLAGDGDACANFVILICKLWVHHCTGPPPPYLHTIIVSQTLMGSAHKHYHHLCKQACCQWTHRQWSIGFTRRPPHLPWLSPAW